MPETTATVAPAFDFTNPSSCILDLSSPKPKQMLALVEELSAFIQTNPATGPLPVHTGWNDINPETALALLMRNLPGANRKVDAATIFYYGKQMAGNDWKPTGQPILFDTNGRLVDAQHRLYAALVSGSTIRSYVVTDVPADPTLFAYIDNNRPRTAATALQTMGLNGVSPVIAKVIKIGEEVRTGVYNPSGGAKLGRMSPADIVKLAERYPNAQKAARSAASDWESAVTLLGRKDVVAYFGMRVIDLFGEEKADDFFDDVMNGAEGRDSNDPILALIKLAERDAREEKPMKRHYMLAALIKVFNSWLTSEPLGRRWMLQVNEDFPCFIEREPQAEAAE
jgi:hypothetical protein